VMTKTTPPLTPIRDRVNWPQLLAYGSGGIIPIALFNIAGQLMGLIGNIGLGLSAFWLGLIMIFPRLWDAFSDPIMGRITDHTRSRWGRRRPYLLLGGIAVGVSFVGMWWIPDGQWIRGIFPGEGAYDGFRLGYILFWLILFFTATTIFEIPHGALGMEMSTDTHERTRLFSAKSFMGNLFALGTPWLFFLANLEFFRGAGGNEVDGMRYVSILVAAVLMPLSFYWFSVCREPARSGITAVKKSSFWQDIRVTCTNRTFLRLVGIFFTLGMGFNFVALLNYYISIFYLYSGDKVGAGPLLGVVGTVWAVTTLLAVFPLNWLGRRFGKRRTLIIAILLMAAGQICKIFCYNPQLPYLVLIPTVLISGGMLMFFTLGPSMLADICDEDELHTGTRSEGSYYSIYWWVFKMGTAFASLVTGLLITFSQFDETQSSTAGRITGALESIHREVSDQEANNRIPLNQGSGDIQEEIQETRSALEVLREQWTKALSEGNEDGLQHHRQLLEYVQVVEAGLDALENDLEERDIQSAVLASRVEALREVAMRLSRQEPGSLLRLRVIEISLPILLSAVSLLLVFRYPLSEDRCYEIREILQQRHAAAAQREDSRS
jgi:GPH family glycoside/pentoside/hexuronide:cation symporter